MKAFGEGGTEEDHDFVDPTGDNEAAAPVEGGDTFYGDGLSGLSRTADWPVEAGAAEEIGFGRAGSDTEDVDIGVLQLLLQGETPTKEEGLGRTVGGDVGGWLEAGGGGDVHYRTTALLQKGQ